VPAPLALDLNLPPGTSFETLAPADVEVADCKQDRRLVGHLTTLAGPLLESRLDLRAPAFPQGLTSTINLAEFPVHTWTRNRLEQQGLFSVDALARLSLGELFAVHGFGVTCLVDLLTALEAETGAARRDAVTAAAEVSVDALERRSLAELLAIPGFGANGLVDLHTAVEVDRAATLGDALTAGPFAERPEMEAATLSPRLTREARLLGSEPWSNDVSAYDIRFGQGLLKDEEAKRVVREALVTGRIGRDQRLCAEPPRWDVDLLLCPLEPRTRRLLLEAGLTTLSALAPLTIHALLGSAGFGVHSLADLVATLDLCPILSSACEPIDGEPTLADSCRAVVDRTRDPRFPERLADRIDQTRAKGIRCLTLPLEEELSDLAASTRGFHPDVVIECLGWDGGGRRSGARVARAHGWTRERVRQHLSRMTDRLADAPPWAPTLRRALGFCERARPLPVKAIAIQLQQNGLAKGPFHPAGLITAAEVFGLTHSLSIRRYRGANWLFQRDQEMLLSTGQNRCQSMF